MLTSYFLDQWHCPVPLREAANALHTLVIERFGNHMAAHRDALDVMEEVLTDPMIVLISGAAADLFGQLEPEVRNFAAAVIVERDPVGCRAWAKCPGEEIRLAEQPNE